EVHATHGGMADEPFGRDERQTGTIGGAAPSLRADVRAIVHLGEGKSGGESPQRVARRAIEGPRQSYCDSGEVRRGKEQTGGFAPGNAGRPDDARVSAEAH